MLHQAVGLGTLGAFAVKIGFFGFLARTTHAAERIDHDMLARNEARSQQRHQRHQNTRRITTRRGDEFRLSLPRRRRELGQDKTRRGQQFRRVMLAVIFLVSRQVGDAEVGAEVDHALARGNEGFRVRRRGAVGQREEK